ncbi:MAG: 7-cyano-7-deazaguanine synthase, partial [Nanoarchaeota archaeon]
MKNALILCSGGLDSVTTAHLAKKSLGYKKIKILFFNYRQRNLREEKKFSRNCALELRAEFIEIPLTWLNKISTSLINSAKKANKLKRKDLKNTREESNKWYVPYRNAVFIINALAFAESL